MALIEITCANPACGRICTKDWQRRKPLPRYCSLSCVCVHKNAQRKAAGVEPWRKYHFTGAMHAAIRRATRQRLGALKALWRDDPRFEAAGIPYPIMKRQAMLLGCVRTEPCTVWEPEERAYALQRLAQGSPPDVVSNALRQRGWHRSPGAIVAMAAQAGERRNGNYLSLNQIAQGLGLDSHVPGRWVRQGRLRVHHTSDQGGTQFVSSAELRRFLAAHPVQAGKGQPDVVWLIGVLSMPSIGETQDHADPLGEDGSWLNGDALRDRAVAD